LEGFGYVAAEAMACGTPVITSNSSSLPEIVVDKETGILCPPNDVEAFVEAVRSITSEPNRRQKMGKAARIHASREFSLERMGSEYAELLNQQMKNAIN
jgi:glycosyltransferase involved in cell wall biosynthesis